VKLAYHLERFVVAARRLSVMLASFQGFGNLPCLSQFWNLNGKGVHSCSVHTLRSQLEISFDF